MRCLLCLASSSVQLLHMLSNIFTTVANSEYVKNRLFCSTCYTLKFIVYCFLFSLIQPTFTTLDANVFRHFSGHLAKAARKDFGKSLCHTVGRRNARTIHAEGFEN